MGGGGVDPPSQPLPITAELMDRVSIQIKQEIKGAPRRLKSPRGALPTALLTAFYASINMEKKILQVLYRF